MTETEHPAKVIEMRQHANYRPDLAALARNQISSARQRLNLTHEQFAVSLAPLLGWSPTAAIVESWETTSTPPGDALLAAGMSTQTYPSDIVSVALSSGAEQLLDLLSSLVGDLERITGSPDVLRAYAMRGLIARPEWNGIVRGAQKHLWLYGMAELGYALDDQVPAILSQAAQDGCEIRVLLLDPDYEGIPDLDLDEGNPAGTLAPRIRAAATRFSHMAEDCGTQMQIRIYNAPPTVSIVRADDRMLVTPYLRFFIGGNSPTFELKNTPMGNIFNRYTRHFENMWNLAREWTR